MGDVPAVSPHYCFMDLSAYVIMKYGFCIIVGTNTSYLSGVVNGCFSCNLKTLVNRYRIEYAKELLVSQKCNLHEIPRLCGFSSRSAFYAAFQRLEGKIPMACLRCGNVYKLK